MNIWKFNRAHPASLEQMEKLGDYLLGELSNFLKTKLAYFKIHIVERESFVGTFRNLSTILSIVNIQVEGVVLFQMRDSLPSINAELLLFADEKRVGLKKHSGNSYLLLNYFEGKGWSLTTWMKDIDEWERTEAIREDEYGKLKKTIDK